MRRICEKIETAALKVGGSPLSATLPPIFNLPFHQNPHFTGRDDTLTRLRAALTSSLHASRAALTGMGGLGKTQLAVEHAYAYMSEYKIVWWLKAENPSTLADDYAALAPKLKLPESRAAEQQISVEAVRDWLEHNGGWLLIFDNAPGPAQVSGYLPKGGDGHVIFTSRNPLWTNTAHTMPIAGLARDESVKFLLERTGKADEAAATKLAEALGDLPLALEQAGAYIEERGFDISSYLELFNSHQKALLDKTAEAAIYPRSVAFTLGLSVREIREASPAGVDLLNLCSFFAPTSISLRIIGTDAHPHHLPDLPDSFAAVVGTDLPLADAAMSLRRYSMAELRAESLSMHRLAQAVVRDRLPKAEKLRWAKIAVNVLNCAFPSDCGSPKQWQLYSALLPHALAVAEHAEANGLMFHEMSRLLHLTAGYLAERAEYGRALTIAERAVAITEAVHGPDSGHMVAVLGGAGNAAAHLGELDKAKGYYERALDVAGRAYEEDPYEMSLPLHNLGSILLDEGNYEEAKSLMARSLALEETKQPPDQGRLIGSANGWP